MAIANITGNILTDSGVATSSLLPLTGGTLTDTLNGTTANFTSSVTGNFFIASPVATSAQSGGLRLNSQVAINARNAANSADITLITTNSSDGVAIRNGALNINSSGNVGIGTSSPQSLFDVTNVVNTAYDGSNTLISGQTMRISNTSTTSGISANLLFIATGAGGGNGLGSISGVNTGTGSLALTFATRDSGGSVTERMRINSQGQVLINTTTASRAGLLEMSGSSVQYNLLSITDTGVAQAGVYYIAFWNSSGNLAGGVQHPTNSTVSYYTGPSDQRLKSNIKDVEESVLPLFDDVKLKTYNHIADEDESIVYKGFLAQEMVDRFPEAYGLDKEGYYTFNPNGYIPYLVKAIQELSAKVSALENKS